MGCQQRIPIAYEAKVKYSTWEMAIKGNQESDNGGHDVKRLAAILIG